MKIRIIRQYEEGQCHDCGETTQVTYLGKMMDGSNLEVYCCKKCLKNHK